MPYNDAFTKMVGDTSATFKTEITAVQDNVTDEIGAPILEGGKYQAKGDLNEIIQEIINNDVLLKVITDKLRVDLDMHANNKNNPHTTTKGQIGLGNVENYTVTSSVSDPSNTKYSTAGAVKTAYDKAVSVLEESRKNCPYRVGDILTTTLPDLPSVIWLGTTWQKVEGKYLKGSKGSEASKATGGSNTKTLTVDQIPSHGHSASGSTGNAGKHTHTANHGHSGAVGAHTHTANHNHSASQSAHAHTQPAHTHSISRPRRIGSSGVNNDSGWSGDTGVSGTVAYGSSSNGGENTGSAQPSVTVNTTNVTTSSTTPTLTINSTDVTTSETADHSHSVSVSVGATGGGQAIDIQPEYYIVHYWLRTA